MFIRINCRNCGRPVRFDVKVGRQMSQCPCGNDVTLDFEEDTQEEPVIKAESQSSE